MSVYADDVDLEARIAALEERVAALEAQLGMSTETETSDLSEYSFTDHGYTITYKRCEVGKDLWGNDCAILYFDFTNESGETGSAGDAFLLKAYQHDKEIDFTSVNGSEWYTELRSGADTLEVAFPFEITDTSEIIVSVITTITYSKDRPEFTISLE